MLEAFLNTKRRRLIPTVTIGIFWPLVSRKPIGIFWKETLSSSLNCRLLKVWEFIYYPVLIVSQDLSFELERKQRGNEAFVSRTRLYSIRSLCIMRECRRSKSKTNSGLWGLYPLNITLFSLATLRLEHLKSKKKLYVHSPKLSNALSVQGREFLKKWIQCLCCYVVDYLFVATSQSPIDSRVGTLCLNTNQLPLIRDPTVHWACWLA